jgi:hypothetical protein
VMQNLSYTLKTDDPPHAHPHHLVVKSRCPALIYLSETSQTHEFEEDFPYHLAL